MNEKESSIRNISDTAYWVAVYRARESERQDALFRDPYARRLAGPHGEEIAENLKLSEKEDGCWIWPVKSTVIRTYLFDRLIAERVAQGVDLVVNLAAGLDARPYRMKLPPALRWVEVDLPELFAYKEEILNNEKPRCSLERIALDLRDIGARREMLNRLGRRANRALIVTEGLLTYLTEDEVGSLAKDIAKANGIHFWTFNMLSPGLLRMAQRLLGRQLGHADASLKFGPKEGPGFFTRYGWRPLEVHSVLKTAARLKRLSFWMRLLALLPESTGAQGSYPWMGICLLEKS